MMTFYEIKKRVIAEYNKRQLVSDARYQALDDLEQMLKIHGADLIFDVSKFPDNKAIMKAAYEKYRSNQGLKMSDAASSMINEVYNQLNQAGVILTDYFQK